MAENEAPDASTTENPLSTLKKQLKGDFDDFEKYVWDQVQAAIRSSYHNGIEEGKRQAANGNSNGDKPKNGGKRWQSSRRASSEES